MLTRRSARSTAWLIVVPVRHESESSLTSIAERTFVQLIRITRSKWTKKICFANSSISIQFVDLIRMISHRFIHSSVHCTSTAPAVFTYEHTDCIMICIEKSVVATIHANPLCVLCIAYINLKVWCVHVAHWNQLIILNNLETPMVFMNYFSLSLLFFFFILHSLGEIYTFPEWVMVWHINRPLKQRIRWLSFNNLHVNCLVP